jgi:colanic acid/amylovoran biosynthesis glycosyltransferase
MAGKPKVVIFCDHLLYPSETFIQAQVGALREYEPVFAGSRRVPGLELPAEKVYLVNEGGPFAKFHEIRFKVWGTAPALTKQLKELKPVLLHAHYGPNGLRVLPLVSRLKVPLITTFHGTDITITDIRHHKTYLGFRYYMANRGKLKASSATFLAVSKFVERRLLDHGFPADRTLLAYTGIDTTKFRPASAEDRPNILFVGRLVKQKGAEFAIRAAGEVQKQLPDVELVLIGDGSMRQELENLAKQSLRRYRFLGMRTPGEVHDWMSRASVICMPSVTMPSGEAEGFGMVCAEAQAVGKPVVAFQSGAISEIIRHERTGFLAVERDWQSLAQYLVILLQNADLRLQFGLAGREVIVREFNLERCTRRLEEIYDVVSGTQRASIEENRCSAYAIGSSS